MSTYAFNRWTHFMQFQWLCICDKFLMAGIQFFIQEVSLQHFCHHTETISVWFCYDTSKMRLMQRQKLLRLTWDKTTSKSKQTATTQRAPCVCRHPPVPAVARSWQRQPPWWASSLSALRLPPRRSHRRGSSSASPHPSPRSCCPASRESEGRRIQQDKGVTGVTNNKHCRQSGYQGKLSILTGSSRKWLQESKRENS